MTSTFSLVGAINNSLRPSALSFWKEAWGFAGQNSKIFYLLTHSQALLQYHQRPRNSAKNFLISSPLATSEKLIMNCKIKSMQSKPLFIAILAACAVLPELCLPSYKIVTSGVISLFIVWFILIWPSSSTSFNWWPHSSILCKTQNLQHQHRTRALCRRLWRSWNRCVWLSNFRPPPGLV